MSDVAAAFPRRPVSILGSGAPSPWLAWLIGAACLAATVALAVWTLPAFIRDLGIMQNPIVVQDASIRNAKCTTRKFVFVDCEASIAYRVGGQTYQDSRSIFFLDMHSGNYRSGVVRSATRPQDATLSIAIDYFWNRALTVGIFAGLLLLGAGAGLMTGLRNFRLGRTVGSEAMPIEATPVDLTEVKKGWFGTSSFTFKAPVDGKARTFVSKFGKEEEPLVSADGTCWAVIPAGVPTAVLLDRDLARLELSDEERQRIWAAASGPAREAA